MKEAYELLELPSSVLIGSRALVVNGSGADFDVAVLKSELPKRYKSELLKDVKTYFSVLPLQNSALLRRPGLDIIIFSSSDDLNSVATAIQDLKHVPDYIMKVKSIRIHLFQTALINYGFRANTATVPKCKKGKKDVEL